MIFLISCIFLFISDEPNLISHCNFAISKSPSLFIFVKFNSILSNSNSCSLYINFNNSLSSTETIKSKLFFLSSNSFLLVLFSLSSNNLNDLISNSFSKAIFNLLISVSPIYLSLSFCMSRLSLSFNFLILSYLVTSSFSFLINSLSICTTSAISGCVCNCFSLRSSNSFSFFRLSSSIASFCLCNSISFSRSISLCLS